MKLFRPASTTAAAAVSVAAALALAAAPAHAAETWITFSYESPDGGWGYSTVTPSSTSMKQLTCDEGTPDGLRTVSHLTMPNGNVHTLHAAQGSGKCIDGSYSPMRGTYVLEVCLRNGTYGTDRYCDENVFTY